MEDRHRVAAGRTGCKVAAGCRLVAGMHLVVGKLQDSVEAVGIGSLQSIQGIHP